MVVKSRIEMQIRLDVLLRGPFFFSFLPPSVRAHADGCGLAKEMICSLRTVTARAKFSMSSSETSVAVDQVRAQGRREGCEYV